MRWIGHSLRAECEVNVSPGITAVQARQVTVTAGHALLHAVPRLAAALGQAGPMPLGGAGLHQILGATGTHPPQRLPTATRRNCTGT